jgi:regulatory protein
MVVRDRLLGRGHDEAIVDVVLDRLTEDGWLDDRAFAMQYAQELLRRRSAGPRLIQAKLEQQGVDERIIERVVDALDDPAAREELMGGRPSDGDAGADRAAGAESPTIERALLLAERRLKQWRGLERSVQMRRVAGLLGRRGYDEDQVRLVLERLGLSPDVV